jgi:large subunit ribosomal protein L25
MEKQELQVHRRWKTGKGPARRLRAGGYYPAICYRKGIEPIPLILEKKKLETILQKTGGQNVLIQLQILDDQDGSEKQEAVILKELQKDHMSRICHVDFLAVRMDEAILVETPVKLIGEPIEALREGGVVQQLRRTLEVECLPGDIPESFEVDISDLKIGESFHVEQIDVSEGIRILTDPKEPLVLVSAPTAEEEEAPEEEEELEAAEEAEGKSEEEPPSS